MYFLGIEAFLAIMQSGSLKKAADSLYLTQATISYRLKTLEKLVGKTLIERNKGSHIISLTTSGKEFVCRTLENCRCFETILSAYIFRNKKDLLTTSRICFL